MDKWIVPSKFTEEDILFMFESLHEIMARVDGFDSGDVGLDELLIVNIETKRILEEIEGRVGVQSKYLLL